MKKNIRLLTMILLSPVAATAADKHEEHFIPDFPQSISKALEARSSGRDMDTQPLVSDQLFALSESARKEVSFEFQLPGIGHLNLTNFARTGRNSLAGAVKGEAKGTVSISRFKGIEVIYINLRDGGSFRGVGTATGDYAWELVDFSGAVQESPPLTPDISDSK